MPSSIADALQHDRRTGSQKEGSLMLSSTADALQHDRGSGSQKESSLVFSFDC